MQTVPEIPTARKPLKAFRATLRDEAGTLAKVDGVITFCHDSGEIVDIEPEDCVWLCVLAEVGISETQQIMDRLHGGAARIACDRQMEVA